MDPALGHIPRQVDWFPGHRWSGTEFGPNRPFPGQVWPGCFQSVGSDSGLREGGGGGGGHCQWRLYQMREKENMEKGYVFQGWTRYARMAKKVYKLRENVSKSLWSEFDRRAIIRGKGRLVKTTCTLILTSNQRLKTSEFKPRICVKGEIQ